MPRRLYRSRDDKFLGGVCGGLGEYFEIDPTLVRLITVVLTLASAGAAILGYILAWIIIPLRTEGAPERTDPIKYPSWSRYLPGLVLVIIGALMLMREFWFWFRWNQVWPIALILFGIFLVFRHTNRDRRPADRQSMDGAGIHSENGGNFS